MNLGDEMKRILFAGIGAVALTVEKAGEIIDRWVEKGEITVEQGKELMDEYSQRIKEKKDELGRVQVAQKTQDESAEQGQVEIDAFDAIDALAKRIGTLTSEQFDMLRNKVLSRPDDEDVIIEPKDG